MTRHQAARPPGLPDRIDGPVLAFPGQGVDVDAVRRTLADHGDDPLVRQVRGESGIEDWSALDLTDTAVAQPAVFTAGVLRSRQPAADGAGLVLGHSLGELTALTVGGAFAEADALTLVTARGRICARAAARTPGSMVAVMALDDATVELVRRLAVGSTGGPLDVAARNGRQQTVLSGTPAAVDRCVELVTERQGMAARLPIGGGFHSSMMWKASGAFAEALAATPMARPQIPWLSTIDLEIHRDPAAIRAALARALVLPVRWLDAMELLAGAAPDTVVDVGPGATLRGLSRRLPVRLQSIDDLSAPLPAQRP